MDGWTLSTIHDPSDPDFADRIDGQLLRIADGASGYPCARPLPDDDLLPPCCVRIGDDTQTVVCDSKGLRDALEDLLPGTPVDVVWRVLLVWIRQGL